MLEVALGEPVQKSLKPTKFNILKERIIQHIENYPALPITVLDLYQFGKREDILRALRKLKKEGKLRRFRSILSFYHLR